MVIGVEPATVFIEQMRIATAQYLGAVAGVSRSDALRRPGEASNPVIWIAGHLVYFRSQLARSLGNRHDFPWGSRFATGSRLENAESYPDLQEFRQMWLELDAVLRQRIATYTAEVLAAAPPGRMASADGTLGGALATFAFHEVYHIGQLGYLRKWLGYSPLFEG